MTITIQYSDYSDYTYSCYIMVSAMKVIIVIIMSDSLWVDQQRSPKHSIGVMDICLYN